MASNLSAILPTLLLLLLVIESVVQSRTLKPDGHSSKFFQSLEGSYKGQTVKGLQDLKRYLIGFGYLNYNDQNNINYLTDNFDDSLESALKTYQKNYNLKVTGILDSDTIKEMMIKRCGNPDIIHHNSSNTAGHQHKHGHKSDNFHMVAHYSFFQGMPKWPRDKTHLTYSFPSAIPVISLEELRSFISRAFQKWADVSQFTFEEATGGAQADLQIGFYRRDHGDGSPFDGPGNVLAHAFQPKIGLFHFDADDSWSTNPNSNQVDLESVAVHEIGHLLGLGHSMDRNAIMFSEIPAGTIKRELNQDDINGIRALYSN